MIPVIGDVIDFSSFALSGIKPPGPVYLVKPYSDGLLSSRYTKPIRRAATYYIDPTAADDGDGSLSNPYNNWESVAWASGNTYLQKRDTEYCQTINVCASGTEDAWIVLDAYGSGAKPKLTITGPKGLVESIQPVESMESFSTIAHSLFFPPYS